MLDEEIIELFFERSEKAIEELEAKYGKICLQTSYNILGNYSDAEECVNDSYLGAWNAIPPARPAPLLTYVLKIVRNLSLNCYHRNQARKRNSTYDLAVEELSEFLAAPESAGGEGRPPPPAPGWGPANPPRRAAPPGHVISTRTQLPSHAE